MGHRLTIRMPFISLGDSVTIRSVLVRVREFVRCGQPLFELDTDKAIVEMPSPADGVVEAVLVAVGHSVNYNSPLLMLRVATDQDDEQWVAIDERILECDILGALKAICSAYECGLNGAKGIHIVRYRHLREQRLTEFACSDEQYWAGVYG